MSASDANLPSAPLSDKVSNLPETVSMLGLLEQVPLHSPRHVQTLFHPAKFGHLEFPNSIAVHCEHEQCDGVRRHYLKDAEKGFHFGGVFYNFAVYECANCVISAKVFGVRSKPFKHASYDGICAKIYQEPSFGNPIPKRLYHIIGEANREHFLQARRAIARGLGIGAYAYYRRIVENTKFDLVSSVLEVAKATKADPGQIQLLEKAKSETQFSKAIDLLRGASAIPAVLLIDGQNPLALLHDALSEGIHELNDSECLTRATASEVVLCEVAERMQMAMTERKSVKAALSTILNRKKGTGAPSAGA